MANSNGWGDGAANNSIGWGQGANNNIGWGDSHAKSWAGATDIVGITTDPASTEFFTATGITGATQQTAIDNLVKGLKADGLWLKMKAVYPFVTDNRNVLSYSGDLTNALWSKNSITATSTTITETVTNALHYTDQIPFASGQLGKTFTASIEAKPNGRNWIVLGFANESKWVFFDLQNGIIGNNVGGVTATITPSSNGFYRCTISASLTQGQAGMFVLLTTANGVFSAYSGDITKGIYLQNMQLELGSTATTYQPIATTQQAYIASQFKYNLVNPVDSDAAFRLVFNGGWTHSSNGATPNGTNGYADTKLVPSSVLAQNSASIGAYLRTNNTGDYCDIGSSNSPSYNSGLYLFYNITANKDFSRNNNDAGAGGTTTASSGFIVNKRTAFNDMKVIRNNSLILSNGNPTTGRSTSPILISAMNRGGTIELYSNRQTAFNFVSDGLTDTEAANLYTRVQAFQTSLSRQV